ncbi:MAG: Ppx/GppA family phosphatase [Firmicutes bacterium]|nr:Ppx/GppA family phosphatase [Bacillota bacterium]
MEKIAIIDLGSNSARLVIAKVLNGGYFYVIDELKEPVRLAQDMDADGYLRPIRIQQTIKTLSTFRSLYESHDVDKVFAYGTSVVRKAKNQKSFIDEVQNSCGIKLQVLSQEEEATYVYNGVINSMDAPKGLIVDIGGGSIKLINYNRRVLNYQDTLPFGAVTLTERFSHIIDPIERASAIESYVTESLKNLEWLHTIEPESAIIGVGGSIRNLGRISRRIKKYPLDMSHNYSVNYEEFDTIYDTIKPLALEKTSRIKGLSSARADIFPAALSVISAIKQYLLGHLETRAIRIAGAGLREGAMLRYAHPPVIEKPINDILGHSIYTLLNHFDMNIEHAEHVFELSMQLFRQLKVLHKLPRPFVKILRVASMLHDVGASFKFYDHHKHSMYIILNSNLYGIPQKDLIMSAIVAGCHAKDTYESLDIAKYLTLLTPEDIEAVKKLGVIVRIAESFDRSCSDIITGISCDVLGDSVILKTKTTSDASLEIKDAMSVLPEFKKAFKKNLEIL